MPMHCHGLHNLPMPSTIIAAAQSASVPQDVDANLNRHLRHARLAAEHSVSLLLFPELSLTGYELSCLGALTVNPDSALLDPLRILSQEARMVIVVGAPLASQAGRPSIGAICLLPDGTTSTYSKRFLHAGERAFATAGSAQSHTLKVNGEWVSIAICADAAHREHPQWAVEAGASVYAAGVLWSQAGYDADAALMKEHCAVYGFAGLAANHAAPAGGYLAEGRSAFWAPGGELLLTAPSGEQALLIAERRGSTWTCSVASVAP